MGKGVPFRGLLMLLSYASGSLSFYPRQWLLINPYHNILHWCGQPMSIKSLTPNESVQEMHLGPLPIPTIFFILKCYNFHENIGPRLYQANLGF